MTAGLQEGTTYDVAVALTDDFNDMVMKSFTTLPSDPSLLGVSVGSITQTTAVATVNVANPGNAQTTVHLKYSIKDANSWKKFNKIATSGSENFNLTGLTPGTMYEVQASLSRDFADASTATFNTLSLVPSISGLSVGSITQTTATATTTIANTNGGSQTVHLRYRGVGPFARWSSTQTKNTTTGSASIGLTGLTANASYQIEVSLASSFSVSQTARFTTLAFPPSISALNVDKIQQTAATAHVQIANAGTEMKKVFLRHRVKGTDDWTTRSSPSITYGDSASIDLAGLEEQTTYEVAVSLSSNFTDMLLATFTTLAPLAPDPSVSGVNVGSIKQTSAVATATIANPGTAQKTIYLQYRVTGTDEWNDSALTATTDGSSATIDMTGLTADTQYEVQVSLDSSFTNVVSETFTTLRFPSISDLEVRDETKNSATAVITIADPDGSRQTIHLRYRTTTPQGEWSGILETTSTTAVASLGLTGLAPDTEYEAEVSLTSDFAVSETDTFRTLPPDPVVSNVSVNGIRQTTATAAVDIANSDGSEQIVHLQYRTTTPRGNWSNIQTATSATDSASIDLSGLNPGTEYDVQASLDDSFPTTRTKSATFTTLRWPSIASFEAENIGMNGATVGATIADSQGVAQTVYVRHRAAGYIAWRPTQQVDSVDDIASLRLRGLSSGTEYIAEASLDNSFPDGGTKSVTFTTKKREDDDESSSGSVIVQAARATNIPLLGFSPQMLRFTAIEGGDNPPPQAFLVWNRAQGSMSFTLSNQQEWLSQQPTSGVSNGPDDQVTITASVDSSALASGQYVDIINIDVSSSGKSPAQVIVVLDVLPPDYIRQFVSRDEGGVVVLPDGTVKIVVQPLSPPKDVDIELMKLNLQAYGQPLGEQERVVVAIESNTYEPGGDTPEDVAYAPYVELWVQLPQEDAAACDESRARVYSVQSGAWSPIEHRCETDESGNVWVVAEVERLGAFALVIDDAPVSPTPTPVAAAVAATPTPTAIPASAPAVAVQRISLPAQPPTPVPTSVLTAVPMPNVKTTVAPAMAPTPTPTAVPTGNEPSAPMMQASAGDGGSGGFGRIILAALGVPMLIGTLIVVYLLYRERRRRDDARMI